VVVLIHCMYMGERKVEREGGREGSNLPSMVSSKGRMCTRFAYGRSEQGESVTVSPRARRRFLRTTWREEGREGGGGGGGVGWVGGC